MEETTIQTKDGRAIRLEDTGSEIVAYDGRTKIGELTYIFREGDPDDRIPDSCALHSVEVDPAYREQGIATECLRFLLEITGLSCATAPHFTDTQKVNGNYLTGDGAGFVAAMRKDRLVCPHQNDMLGPYD